MEYDVRTAGVRVSFIMVDGYTAILPVERLLAGGESREGHWVAPQSPENIKILIAVLEAILDNP
jgi:hypothetical protein